MLLIHQSRTASERMHLCSNYCCPREHARHLRVVLHGNLTGRALRLKNVHQTFCSWITEDARQAWRIKMASPAGPDWTKTATRLSPPRLLHPPFCHRTAVVFVAFAAQTVPYPPRICNDKEVALMRSLHQVLL